MTIWIAISVYAVVHLFGAYVLRASGTWAVLFAPAMRLAVPGPDPLASSPRGWIENHEFWDLADETETVEEQVDDDPFWGRRSGTAG